MKNPEQLTLLFEKYIANGCSIEETQRLMDYFHVSEDQELLTEMVTAVLDMQGDNYRDNPVIAGLVAKVDEDLFKHIQANHESRSLKGIVKLWPRIVAIAAAVALIVAGVYFFNYRSDADRENVLVANDVSPGSVGATLTLASGKQIKLSDAANGEIAKEAGISVTKTADGQLVYEVKSSLRDKAKQSYNTLTTAKGETYIITLPDKSKVWMNAASSLTYSASLNEDGLRRVKLEGEAYFQVAKDKAHPFIVESRGQEVEVLGTHFNVNAYGDEPVVATTLLEGSVKVTNSKTGVLKQVQDDVVLKPGEQALNSGNNIKVEAVNVESITDWKNDEFNLDRINFKVAMRKIARWYDIEVIYNASVANDLEAGGWISRNEKLSAVLKSIESTGFVHFRIEGKKVYVTK